MTEELFRIKRLRTWIAIGSLVFLSAFCQVCLAETIPPMDPRTRAIVEEALKAEDRGDIRRAITLHKQVVKIQPRNAVSLNAIAGLYGINREFNEEIFWAKKAIKADPNYDLAFVNLGNAYTELHDFKRARNAFMRAVEVNKKSPVGFYSLGVLSERERDLPAAVGFYKKALEVDPNFKEAMLNLGATYANLGKFKVAKEILERLIRLNPQSVDARNLLREVEKELQK